MSKIYPALSKKGRGTQNPTALCYPILSAPDSRWGQKWVRKTFVSTKPAKKVPDFPTFAGNPADFGPWVISRVAGLRYRRKSRRDDFSKGCLRLGQWLCFLFIRGSFFICSNHLPMLPSSRLIPRVNPVTSRRASRMRGYLRKILSSGP